jgi:hypothetical protein
VSLNPKPNRMPTPTAVRPGAERFLPPRRLLESVHTLVARIDDNGDLSRA